MANDVKTESSAKPRLNIGAFITDTRREISKVTWPSRKETLQMTVMIVVMALVTGVFFLAVDTGLGYVISHILGMNS
jgi:preprotein translocase subunit SecE